MFKIIKIFIITNILIFSSSSIANNCYQISGDYIQFVGGANCSLETCDSGANTTNFQSLLSGNNDGGYSLHITVNRDDINLSSEQSLITFYEDFDASTSC